MGPDSKTEEKDVSYKTILVHVDESRHAGERIRLAAAVAMTEKAHLIGTATTGASRYIQRNRMLAELDPHFQTHLDFLRQRARRGLEEFDGIAQALGLPSFEGNLVDDEAGGGICLQARYCDLVVIGQNDPKEPSPVVMPDFPQYVVLNAGRPVLLTPHACSFSSIGNHVVVAWDASMAAARAISGALPLLRRAQQVDVAIFDLPSPTGNGAMPESPDAGADISRYLQRHGIKVGLQKRHAEGDVGHALLDMATSGNCDLMVMGFYGHTRFREIMLGSVSATVLEAMRLPVLMSN
ncbi:Nucleotide-binding universal stress protein, UspA family [Noviherbaspirillum humi]|uniref:Nucleotide-binding universal stress protein, UspA family n=2 Tax=Noviherbaspirillum humi TaxID=1688639 RepID=A0A239J4B1_9BURK|nr:Nucleotide-binding universal stress protein, UspA family [Noviherbaspirillum humi]